MAEHKLKMTFVGTGSAFTLGDGNYQSNVLLEAENGEKLLLDCGSDIRFGLFDLGYSYRDIKNVYISHLHADHIGGLEWLGLSTIFDPRCTRPVMFIANNLSQDLWEHSLSGGMNTIQGSIASLDTFFDVKLVTPNGNFVWQGIEFKLVQTVHIISGFRLMPCFGLMFEVNGKKIFFTADSQCCPHQLQDFYNMADVIFHDCETMKNKSGVHAHYSELVTLAPEIKRKMWLYHYNPGKLPDAVADGFIGFVLRKQQFLF